MNIISLLKNALGCFVLTVFPLSFANATLITFEAHGTNAPRLPDGNVNSPLTIGLATFTGGELLKNIPSAADESVVYATTSVFPPTDAVADAAIPAAAKAGYNNPLTITFSQPVNRFSLLLTDALPGSYTIIDNLDGQTSSALLAGSERLHLTDKGITSVSIYSNDPSIYDFAIDNIRFRPARPVADVPDTGSTLWLMGLGLGSLLLAARGGKILA